MDQTTFADVLQKSFVAMSMGGAERITTLNILLNSTMSFLVGMFIFYIYRKTYQGVLFQRSFAISLVLAATVTAMVIMTISGNLILSLGMVGALSIVRFRTPIKDSIDLIFLFWAIATGIANGVGYFNIAIVGSIMIAIFLFILTGSKQKSADAFLLVLHLDSNTNEAALLQQIEDNTQTYAIKSKTISPDGIELTLEVRTTTDTAFINQMQNDKLVNQATIVAFDQDMATV